MGEEFKPEDKGQEEPEHQAEYQAGPQFEGPQMSAGPQMPGGFYPYPGQPYMPYPPMPPQGYMPYPYPPQYAHPQMPPQPGPYQMPPQPGPFQPQYGGPGGEHNCSHEAEDPFGGILNMFGQMLGQNEQLSAVSKAVNSTGSDFLKGLLVGAGVAMLLGSETVRGALTDIIGKSVNLFDEEPEVEE